MNRGVFISNDNGNTWTQLGDMKRVSVVEPIVDGNGNDILYAGTGYLRVGKGSDGDGLFHRYNFNGKNKWESFSIPGIPDIDPLKPLATYSILVNPNDSNNIWVSTSVGVFSSIDGGESWNDENNGLPSSDVGKMIVNPENFTDKIVLHLSKGPFRSTSGNSGWDDISGNLGTIFEDLEPSAKKYSGLVNYNNPVDNDQWGRHLFIGTGVQKQNKGLLYSPDGGISWVSRSANRNVTYGWHPANVVTANPNSLTVASDGTLWVGKNENFFKSDNPLDNDYSIEQSYTSQLDDEWRHRGMVNTVPRWVTAHPTNPDIIWIAEADRVLWVQ